MRRDAGSLVLSATDLSNFLNCPHRTALEMGEALGKGKRPVWSNSLVEALFARGLEHERNYVSRLSAAGKKVVDLSEIKSHGKAISAALEAMGDGAEVIVQGAVGDRRWYGRPDVLLRVSSPSAFGAWSYEVADTKLAVDTRAGTILQLGLYSDLLSVVQGHPPEHFYVVTPNDEAAVEAYRVNSYAAYFRLLKNRLETVIEGDDDTLADANYPEPVDHCDVCPWSPVCNDKRHKDDHLSIVAGITRIQRTELAAHSIATVIELANTPLPLAFTPRRGAKASYVRVREQARLQLEARVAGFPVYELMQPIEPDKGLCRLPPPSPGDLFLDLEGDPFAGRDGREYLFGIVSLNGTGQPVYQARWALTPTDEARAFNDVIGLIMDAWTADPGMHVYHYAPYEPAAFKRLMGRFAQREQDIDSLLRAGRFVDLYAVVRQGVRAGIERYSIKALEPLYGFTRSVPLLDANRSLRAMEQAIELDRPSLITSEVRDTIQGYNEDDCVSALRLRDWLESLRTRLENEGQVIPRPQPKESKASENVKERAQRVAALRARLLEGVSLEASARDPDQQVRWLLAYLLDWHRREDKAGWWEYFRLRDLPEEDLLDEPQAVAGLEFIERVEIVRTKKGKPTGSVIDRYRYPMQEMEIRRGDDLKLRTEEKFGEVVQVNRAERSIDIRKGPKMAEVHPSSAFEHKYVNVEVIENAIFAIGEGFACGKADKLAVRLLHAEPPSTISGTFANRAGETAVQFAVRVGLDLAQSVLAIQGPPGTGKTFTGAQMICALVAQGKRVGVIATGHSVIRNLLDAVAEAAAKLGRNDITLGHKVDTDYDDSSVLRLDDNAKALEALQSGAVKVLGGTAWLWSRPEFAKSADVLFVDEAGQMSLANVLAVTQGAHSIVLLGDPQQLEQPKKGTHPEGVGLSALQHMLGLHVTIPEGRGIFLPETWRLTRAIASFTSEAFYEDRLRSKPGLERQQLFGSPFIGSALWAVDVNHEGNRNASDEEVEAVDRLVTDLLKSGSRWVDELGREAQMTGRDILVVAPFNAQVGRLAEKLAPRGVSVGTVDKFQGQEAAVAIYSMTTSSPEDAPRGLEFLYSLNRLNVATSRARCAVFVVANPRLFAPDCKTPRQIELANALCRYRELATIV
ncbi:MAG: TM0106 family RecB-like putative nuclease [Hyphomicrobiales bacterium]|nr:TM0106 family RecB-like putative nuclease [Hyphomicrobiales bacterium]